MRAHPGVRYCGHALAGLGLLGATKAQAPSEAGRAAGMTLLSAMETGSPRPWAAGYAAAICQAAEAARACRRRSGQVRAAASASTGLALSVLVTGARQGRRGSAGAALVGNELACAELRGSSRPAGGGAHGGERDGLGRLLLQHRLHLPRGSQQA